jgi:hypothetical protein
MSVDSTIGKVRYEGNGSARRFPVGFVYDDADHLRCYLRRPVDSGSGVMEQVELVRGVDYALEGNGEAGEGLVEYPLSGDPMPAGHLLTILQFVPITQDRSWSNADAIDVREIEKSDDKLTRICQQLQEELERCVKVDVTSDDNPREYLSKTQHAYASALAAADNSASDAATARTAAETASRAQESCIKDKAEARRASEVAASSKVQARVAQEQAAHEADSARQAAEAAARALADAGGAGERVLHEAVMDLVTGTASRPAETMWCVTGLDARACARKDTMETPFGTALCIWLEGFLHGYAAGDEIGSLEGFDDDKQITLSWGGHHYRVMHCLLHERFRQTRVTLHPMYTSYGSNYPTSSENMVLTTCERCAVGNVPPHQRIHRELYTSDPVRLCLLGDTIWDDLSQNFVWTTPPDGITMDEDLTLHLSADGEVEVTAKGTAYRTQNLMELDVQLTAGSIHVLMRDSDGNLRTRVCDIPADVTGKVPVMLPVGDREGSIVIRTGAGGAQGTVKVLGIWQTLGKDVSPMPLMQGEMELECSEGVVWHKGDGEYYADYATEGPHIVRLPGAQWGLSSGTMYCMQVRMPKCPGRANLRTSQAQTLGRQFGEDMLFTYTLECPPDKDMYLWLDGPGRYSISEFHFYKAPAFPFAMPGRLNAGGFLGGELLPAGVVPCADGGGTVRLRPGRGMDPAATGALRFVGNRGQAWQGNLDGTGVLACRRDLDAAELEFAVGESLQRLDFDTLDHALRSCVLSHEGRARHRAHQPVDVRDFPVLLPGRSVCGVMDARDGFGGGLLAELFDVHPSPQGQDNAGLRSAAVHHTRLGAGKRLPCDGAPCVEYAAMPGGAFEAGVALWPFLSVKEGEYWLVCLWKEVRCAPLGGGDVAAHDAGVVVVPESGPLQGQSIWAGTAAAAATNAALFPLPDGGVGVMKNGLLEPLAEHRIIGGRALDTGTITARAGSRVVLVDDGFGHMVHAGSLGAPLGITATS